MSLSAHTNSMHSQLFFNASIPNQSRDDLSKIVSSFLNLKMCKMCSSQLKNIVSSILQLISIGPSNYCQFRIYNHELAKSFLMTQLAAKNLIFLILHSTGCGDICPRGHLSYGIVVQGIIVQRDICRRNIFQRSKCAINVEHFIA